MQTAPEREPLARRSRLLIESAGTSYLALLLGTIALIAALTTSWALLGRDHFGQIPLGKDYDWYLSYEALVSQEIQDRDIFYHGIGNSIEKAKDADIIILGNSLVLWGLRDDLIDDFDRKHNVRIFNLGFAGDASGEFARRIIERWSLKPKLFVINADDKTVSFFTRRIASTSTFIDSNASRVTTYGYLQSYENVAVRNLRWLAEETLYRALPEPWRAELFTRKPLRLWRRISTGGWSFAGVEVYWSNKNPDIVVKRDPHCPTSETELSEARQFVNSLGAPVILTLLPYDRFCAERVKEIGSALRLTTLLPPDDSKYTAVDQAHMDFRGATSFTRSFLAQLTQTDEFKRISR